MESLFISLVRENPAIYDRSNIHYKCRAGIVDELWSSIAEKMRDAGFLDFINGAYAVKQWEAIRHRYTNARKRYNESIKAGKKQAGATPTWSHWEEMQWLDPHLKSKMLAPNFAFLKKSPTGPISDGSGSNTSINNVETDPLAVKRPRTSEGLPVVLPSLPQISNLLIPITKQNAMSHSSEGQLDDDELSVTRFANMVKEQYRFLNEDQRRFFHAKVQKSYLEALEYKRSASDS